MRYVGIDYGSRRVGIAVSDDVGMMAFPRITLAPGEALAHLEALAKEQPTEFVIGISRDAQGHDNKIQTAIRDFALRLHEITSATVHEIPEAFTSFEAHGREGKEQLHARKTSAPVGENIDAKAAALLLQRFLDRHH
jgi:putative Holliday junction resolvase